MKRLLFFLVFLVSSFYSYSQDSTAFLSSYDKYWEIKDGYYRVLQNGKIGMVNQSGNIIIPCEYDQIWNLQGNGNIKVLKNSKLGIYNIEGILIVPAKYDMIWEYKNNSARVLRNGKVGYINDAGYEIIPCLYDQIWDFKDGKAKVIKNGKIGYINESGNEFIPCEYSQIWDFKDGRAKVLKNGKIGFINEQGIEIIPCEFQQIWDFKDGKAKAVKNGKLLYIDTVGNILEEGIDQEDKTDYAISNADTSFHEGNPNIESSVEKDTTVYKFLGSNVKVLKEKDATEYAFESCKERKIRLKDKKKDFHKFNGHYQGLDLGINNYLTADGSLSLPNEHDYLSLNTGKSIEVSANLLQQEIPLGRRGNVGFVTGLGLTFNNYRYENSSIPTIDEDGNLAPKEITDPVKKNKLTTIYVTAPVLFELQFQNHYHHRSDFYLSAGVIGGYKLKSYTKVVYFEDGKKTKDKDNTNLTLNDFRYGAQLRLGYKAINLYGTYYFSPLFETDSSPELYPISIGFCFYPGHW